MIKTDADKGNTIPVTEYTCDLCKKTTFKKVERCPSCDYPEISEKVLQLSPKEYCKIFGHDGGRVKVSGSQREEGVCTPRGEDEGSVETVYSYEWLFKCARCGFTKTRRE
jgi:ribosomal protein L37E